jgi:hypothetical protein
MRILWIRIPNTVLETRGGMSEAFLGGVGQEKVDVALVVHTTLHGAEGHSNLKQIGTVVNISVADPDPG